MTAEHSYQFPSTAPPYGASYGETFIEQGGHTYDNPYKFNGKELDPETGLYYYGARYYDPKISLWLSVDPLAEKYPGMSPYNYTAGNPVVFVDYNGEDFGILVDRKNKRITIVANIYVANDTKFNQAQKGAEQWNKTSYKIDGFDVTFKLKVIKVSVSKKEVFDTFGKNLFFKKNGRLKKHIFKKYRELLAKQKVNKLINSDPVGNAYMGYDKDSPLSTKEYGDKFIGGHSGDNFIYMNYHQEMGDMGDYPLPVAHEIGHIMGLDDIGNPYYPGEGSIMQYTYPMNRPNNKDVKTIIQYAQDKLNNPNIKGPNVIDLNTNQ